MYNFLLIEHFLLIQLKIIKNLNVQFSIDCFAQSAGAVEYTDCFSAEG